MTEPTTRAVRRKVFPVESGEKLLNLDEVAERLDVSRRTVERMIERGELPSVQLKRSRRVVAADLEHFIQGNRWVTTDGRFLPEILRGMISHLCEMMCSYRGDGDGGIAVLRNAGLTLWDACPHLLALVGVDDERLDEFRFELPAERSEQVAERLMPLRMAGETYLSADFPLETVGGLRHYDVFHQAIRDLDDGTIQAYTAAVMPAPSPWRDSWPSERVVDTYTEAQS